MANKADIISQVDSKSWICIVGFSPSRHPTRLLIESGCHAGNTVGLQLFAIGPPAKKLNAAFFPSCKERSLPSYFNSSVTE